MSGTERHHLREVTTRPAPGSAGGAFPYERWARMPGIQDLRTELQKIVDTARAERRGLTAEEEARFAELEAGIKARQRLAANEAAEAKAVEARSRLGLGGGAVVRSEPTVYGRGSGNSYFRDLAILAVRPGDPDVAARMARHGREIEVEARDNPGGAVARALGAETRALNTAVGSGGTFLPPAYLLDEFVALPRPERVLAALVRRQDLPKGPMTINIPKIATGTAVASQATQNSAATETDLTDEYVSANVNTLAGQQTVSLQAIEQSSIPFDEIVFQDLLRALDAQVEFQAWQGSGTNGQLAGVLGTAGINAVTYTSSTPTAVAAYPFLGQAKSAVFKSIFRPANAIFLTPDRWAWFETATDNNGRPLVLPTDQGVFAAMGVALGQMSNGPKPVGSVMGLPVFVAPQLPTDLGTGANQDVIGVMSTPDLILWESAPVARALPQTLGTNLSVLLQIYIYAAFMPNRLPGAISTVTGTGLTTPAF